MCGRYKGPEDWAELHAVLSGFVPPREQMDLPMEIRPTNKVPVVVQSMDGYEVAYMRWGLVPGFYKGAIKDWKATTFNARLEEIGDKPTYRTPWRRKSFCLIPAAYFWEWSGPHPTQKGKKQRWRIGRADNHQMVFAGLYDTAATEDGVVTSCTMLTHGSGADMSALHDREPAILHPDEWEPYLAGRLDRDLTEPVGAGTLRLSKEDGFDGVATGVLI